ncbi:MAG: ATPase [Gammaproteobacteria bacterium]|nr:ATPase [Gammaproteobacteria bacterium]
MAFEIFDNIISGENQPDRSTQVWTFLKYLNFYRVILAAIFVSSVFIEANLPVLGGHNPGSFAITAYIYLSIAALSNFAIQWRWPNFELLILVLTLTDITVLTLVMHTSGGIESGLGMLLVLAIAGNSLLIAGRTANLFAAIAAIAVLFDQVISNMNQSVTTNYTQAGILGATLFATAMLSHVLSKRIRESEALAEQRGVDLANLAQLNEHVIKRMQSGVIVVDADARIRLMNESAWYMLGLPSMRNTGNKTLNFISLELANQFEAWKNRQVTETKIFRATGASVDILPSFTSLGNNDTSGTLIFLEDTARMAQQAQHMKLASLGRLTASIAHEIRNPLGAISHADQLLAESKNLNSTDKRLTEIIHSHTKRVNGIIENVLQLSRRGNTMPENIVLNDWLNNFVQEFALSQNIDQSTISHHVMPNDIKIHIDPTQLHQIVWNLSHNGLRFSIDYPANPKLEIRASLNDENSRPFLEIIDHGPGIDPETAQQIFEPFFTTDSMGSGLGLYIARELCELNQAHIQYIPVPSGGSCFRIDFASTGLTH